MKEKRRNKVISFFLLIFFVIVTLFLFTPIVYMLLNSFKSAKELDVDYGSIFDMTAKINNDYAKFKILPKIFSFKQYYDVFFTNPEFFYKFWNSCILVFPTFIGALFVSVLSGYGFAKFEFSNKRKIFLIYVFVMLLPYQITMFPNYIMMNKFGLINTRLSIIIPLIFSPLGTVMMYYFIKKIPSEIIESARIDGASELVILFKIIVPLILQGIATFSVLYIIELWYMIEYPKVFLENENLYPLSLVLGQFNQETIGYSFVCCVIFMTPILIIFLLCKDAIVEKITDCFDIDREKK